MPKRFSSLPVCRRRSKAIRNHFLLLSTFLPSKSPLFLHLSVVSNGVHLHGKAPSICPIHFECFSVSCSHFSLPPLCHLSASPDSRIWPYFPFFKSLQLWVARREFMFKLMRSGLPELDHCARAALLFSASLHSPRSSFSCSPLGFELHPQCVFLLALEVPSSCPSFRLSSILLGLLF